MDTTPAPVLETTIDLGGGSYVARLSIGEVAELQTKRGTRVTWPDGASGVRPKPLGLIWREHCESGEYDIEDSVEILTLALMGGGSGVDVNGEAVMVDRARAQILTRDYIARPGQLIMPLEEIWQTALRVLIACCQGYAAPGGGSGNVAARSLDTQQSTSQPSSETAQSGTSGPPTPDA
jgi:hypothetical protein